MVVQCLNQVRTLRRVTQSSPELCDGDVESVGEVPKIIGRPNPALQFLPGYNLAGLF